MKSENRGGKNKLTLDEVKRRLAEKFDFVELIEYGGCSTCKSKFLDKDFGEFYSTVHLVLRGKKHDERIKAERRDLTRRLWTNPDYVEKVKEGSGNVDWDKVADKRKNTFLERYGEEFALRVKDFKDKAVETSLMRYGVPYFCKSKDGSEAIKKGQIDSGFTKVHDGKTMKSQAEELGKAYTTFQAQVKKYGYEVALSITKKGRTSLEGTMSEILAGIGCKFEEQAKISNKSVDFLVEGNLVVECDGLIWHSDAYLDKNYHKDRMYFLEEQGLRALFFRSNEILEKTDIVRSIIRNCLKISGIRVFARNLEVRNVDSRPAKDFLESNHLMGPGSGKSYGLFDQTELISLMQVKKSKEGLEISRFCSKLNHTVVGGFSKLLKAIELSLKPNFISTFIDLRYGRGQYLTDFGFVKDTEHLSFQWTDFRDTFHRLNFKGNSGYDLGLRKIWDCGQRKYVKTLIQ
jgi:very-short-patch-repair endonuclease